MPGGENNIAEDKFEFEELGRRLLKLNVLHVLQKIHQKCAGFQLPSNRSPNPSFCAENSKEVKLLEFVLVATSECPPGEKTLKD